MLTPNSLKVKEQASERGASSWLTVIPLKDLGYDLNKGEFRDALKLRYNWEVSDIPNWCVCGDIFEVNHAMTCINGGFVIQRHNEIRDLEAALLSTVCKDVEIEPPLRQIMGEILNNGANTSQDARLDILARGFWERQKSTLMSGYSTLMLTPIVKRHLTKSSNSTKMRRNESMPVEYWK